MWINFRDPDEDPGALLFYSAQSASIPGMEKAIAKNPQIIYASESFQRRSALHLAAASLKATAVNAVQWLLEKGIPWNVEDMEDYIPEDIAKACGNEELRMFLRESAIRKGDIAPMHKK